MSGAFIPCTTGRTANLIQLKVLPILCALPNLSTIARFTIGSSKNWAFIIPYQYEFARLNITHTLMSKRKLRQLVEDGVVSGWDDPRMPTLRGMRRRGYTPEAIRTFIDNVGVARANSTVEFAMLEHAVRDDLNTVTPRVMAVLDRSRL